ncbi:MAG TPA: MFS transporter [Myxococcales bacterium]|jgi:MFS family permease
MRLLPASATADARALLATRALRGFADGLVSVFLASYLGKLGFSALEVGIIVTSTLLGSAALTLGIGLLGHRLRRRAVLLGAAALMFATGIGFAGLRGFWPILLVAFVGTINPSAGDVTLFLPTEQAVLSESIAPRDRTLAFAWYNVLGSFAGALGALVAAIPPRAGFVLYAVVALIAAAIYRRLSPNAEVEVATATQPLATSRSIVFRLAAIFCIDSFGGGFVVQALLALWLSQRFGLSVEQAGAFFFVAGICNGASQFASSRLAARIGHVRTMVFTHLPSNALLMLAGVMPTAPLAIACLVLRSTMSSMDVPARQAYVMAMVPREERAAASSVTNVPRALASAISPVLAGALLERTSFGWPLIIGGALKSIYDLLIFASFARLRPDESA